MKLSTKIRLAAGLHRLDRAPVFILRNSDQVPLEKGSSWGYETKGGTPITYPSAYKKTGWSNMVYRPSSRRVEVGDRWVLLLSISSK
jgi:hypothetical protein